ncbi:titin isoform X5 [Phlebotomus argentipes]|uniref:titin isoform X5 n=1 Tax=Phlebotomus argentipes TaxID=94469 RepID=UPI002892C6A7|nr:titin isoform X5 [Phlebotomus argentipes]
MCFTILCCIYSQDKDTLLTTTTETTKRVSSRKMASEPVDLALIHDEELLRRMWQQTDDFARKKEIRAHMYKLRESRLRDFYTGDMDATIGIGKGLGASHGDSLQDQSFESFKTKEIRDSESPTRDYKFDVVAPDTSGWNVITSSEVTNDGKTHTTQTLATTAGVQDVPGGKSSFSGRNEQLSSVTHEGDDSNFTTSAGQSSNTLLQETTVTGDEDSGKTETKSTSVTSSSRVIKSQHTSSGDQAARDHRNVADEFDELLQSARNTSSSVQQSTSLTTSSEKQSEQQFTGQQESKVSTTMTAEAHQKEVERLAALPGEIISRKIDYPDANTKMITETKALDDGTIVTTTKYETRSASSKVWSSASNKQESSSTRSVTEERAQKQRIECIRDESSATREKSHEISHDRETTQQHALKCDTTATDDYAPSEISQFSPQSNKTFEMFEEDTHQTSEKVVKQEYRQDHTSKRVSVEVDAAHDAFARSLRSISPDRGSTKSSTTRLSTDKGQSRRSPSRESDTSRISSNTVTKSKSDLTTHDYQRSTISSERRQARATTPKRPSTVVESTEDEPRDRVPVKEPSPVRRPTQAKDSKPSSSVKKLPKTHDKTPMKDFETDSARSTSPTSTVSDIVYHKTDNRQIITDLDSEEVTEVVKTSQESTNTQSVTETTTIAEGYGDEVIEVQENTSKTPTAPPRKSSIKKTTEEVIDSVDSKETSDETSKRYKLTRSETYEERCRKILGMSETTEETQEKTSQDTVDFLANEVNVETKNRAKSPEKVRKTSSPSKKTPASSPERKPSIKKTPQKVEPVRKSSKNEIKRESVTEITTQSTKTVIKKELKEDDKERKSTTTIITTTKDAPEKKTLGERKKSTGLDTKHVSTAKITISPVASKAKPKDEKPAAKKPKKITHSDYSSEAEDSEKEVPAPEKTPSARRVNKLPVVERKESAPVYSSRQEKESVHKMARSTSENTFRSSARKRSKPDMPEISKSPEKTTKADTKRPTKCITTKTINLTATNHTESAKTSEDVDVIVDIQQAKSSREPTPNRIIPVPVSPEEDTGKPRYPDAVHEPDDERRQPKVKNIPIYEEETSDYIGCSITEVAEDDTNLTVADKVNLFTSLKENSNYERTSFTKESSVDVDEKLKDDECLLSVSDKVSKFITSAEEVKKIKTSTPFSPDRDRDDSLRVDEECLLSVTDKVTKFISTAEDVKKPKVSSPFVPESRPENGDTITDESQLSVTEKVTKFRTRAEKLAETTPQRSPELVAKIDRQVARSKPPTVEKVSEEEFGDFEEEKTRRSSVKDRYSPKEKPVTTSPITLRSTEIVKKAKAVFEQNKSPSAKPKDILSRPSVWEGRKTAKLSDIGVKGKEKSLPEEAPKSEGFFLTEPGNRDTPRELDRAFQNAEKSSPSDSIPSYLKDAVATRKHIFEKRISEEKIRRKSQESVERKPSKPVEDIEPVVEEICIKKLAYQTQPDSPVQKDSVGAKRSLFERKDSLPSYMSPTLSSIEHMNSQRKDSIDINKSNLRKASMEKKDEEYDGNPRSTVKFGVALKRTDSETSQPRRKSSCPEIPHIEEIFELELLERMLETVVGYEQRRRIRAQIRLVKKQMESKEVRKISPSRKLSPRKISGKSTEAPDHTQLNGHKSECETVEIHESRVEKHMSRSPSPPKSLPNLRQMRSVATESKDDKPIWATKNILKKASENNRTYSSRRVVSESKTQRMKTDVSTEPKSMDSVTSSYGIGPTDDNGQPLFGLRALKKKTPGASDSTTKVSGSIVRESYHSVNGADPVGQRTVTLYSSDLADFDQIGERPEKKTPSQIRDKLIESEQSRKVHSVTKTQKIGDNTSPKVVRRGSVKELSEKFIQKEAAITDKSTAQSYPKAGLILRTQTSREDGKTTPKSPDKGRIVVTKTQTVTGDGGGGGFKTTTTTKETRSFLNSANSKVTDVQDVLDRMRNADNVEEVEDSADDREARALLNKFIGASVLMAGMESMMPQQMSQIVGAPVTKQQQVGKSTTKTVKTATTTTKKRPTNIDEIWDEVLLKQLLEQTTNYEERRKLRARLKQVMAEKEEDTL